jgi:hypothetical protein
MFGIKFLLEKRIYGPPKGGDYLPEFRGIPAISNIKQMNINRGT